ncbi:MAG: hypothetical protein AAGG48_27885 [Planctomycetota bacterium]
MRYFCLIVLLFGFGGMHADAFNGLRFRIFGCRAKTRCCCPPTVAVPCVASPSAPVVASPVPESSGIESDDSKQVDFAAIADQIKAAKSISFTVTPYMSFTSKDGERTWLEARARSELIFQAPHYYRDTKYDPRGNVMLVQLVDSENQRFLTLNMQMKTVLPMKQAINVYDPREPNPLGPFVKSLVENPPEWVEKRDVDGTSIDVFRYTRKPRGTTMDIWVDRKKNELVAISQPGSDQLDLSQVLSTKDAPGRRERGRGKMAGMVRSEIKINPDYDPALFSFEVPDGFEERDASGLPGGPAVIVP